MTNPVKILSMPGVEKEKVQAVNLNTMRT